MPSATGKSVWGAIFRPGCLCFPALLLVPLLAAPPAHSHKRVPAVHFDLEYPEVKGALDPGAPFDLGITLSGVSQGKGSIVAIVEGEPFVRRLVPMTEDPDGKGYHSTVRLEAYCTGLVSPREEALRVHVTFARLRGMGLSRFLTRSVYVTMALPVEGAGLNPAPYRAVEQDPITEVEPERNGERSEQTDTVTFDWPMLTEVRDDITEQDLILSPLQALEPAYWQRISHLISRSWRGPAKNMSRTRARGTVKVHFRLYANGDAQLIQVEQSSGTGVVDEAGMQAILSLHPFPPFPAGLEYESVDLHVELSRSGRAVHRAVRPSSPGIRNAASARP